MRQVDFAAGERAYLRDNWETISTVTEILRTERNVRLAVLFGSVARGHATEDSDIDVLVSLTEERPMYLSYLATRLTLALKRDVDVLSLKQVHGHYRRCSAPSLTTDVRSWTATAPGLS